MTRVVGTAPVVLTCTADTGPRPTNTSAGACNRTFGNESTTRGVPSPNGVTDSTMSSPFPVSVMAAPVGFASARTSSSIVANRERCRSPAALGEALPTEPSGNALSKST